jgi:O-antigen ligase
MQKVFAFLWLVILATNWAQYYSEDVPYQGIVVAAGALFFALTCWRQGLQLLMLKDYILVLLLFLGPIALMFLSERSFDRGAYTTQIAVAAVFLVTSILAFRNDFQATIAAAAFTIVLIAASLNFYELFVENNIWSASPGRSAGFYVNPNTSGEAVMGYGLVFLLYRFRQFSITDFILVCLMIVGVFATFSRTAILAFLVLVPAAMLIRSQSRYVMRVIAGIAAAGAVAAAFSLYVVQNLDLSVDASSRLFSLFERGGVGDFWYDRMPAIAFSMALFMDAPLTGAGVRTIYDMVEGPHNMYVAMMVDYGILGAIMYLVILARWAFIAYSGDHKLAVLLWFLVGWLFLFGFASHNLLGHAATIPLIGFATGRACLILLSRRIKPSPPS